MNQAASHWLSQYYHPPIVFDPLIVIPGYPYYFARKAFSWTNCCTLSLIGGVFIENKIVT